MANPSRNRLHGCGRGAPSRPWAVEPADVAAGDGPKGRKRPDLELTFHRYPSLNRDAVAVSAVARRERCVFLRALRVPLSARVESRLSKGPRLSPPPAAPVRPPLQLCSRSAVSSARRWQGNRHGGCGEGSRGGPQRLLHPPVLPLGTSALSESSEAAPGTGLPQRLQGRGRWTATTPSGSGKTLAGKGIFPMGNPKCWQDNPALASSYHHFAQAFARAACLYTTPIPTGPCPADRNGPEAKAVLERT